MGLFDKVFGDRTTDKMTPAEAYCGILLSAVAADGHIAEEEVRGLFTIMGRMKTYDNWTDDKYRAMIDKMLKMLKRDRVEGLVAKCATAIPKELRETAFCNVADLVLADGVVEDEEKELLDRLQKLLEISGDQALTIVEIMVIKNRG